MNKVIITGATSMIGVALVESLLKRNIQTIYAVVRPNSENLYRLPKNRRIQVLECDVDSYSTLSKQILEKCDTFFHLAWSATGTKRNISIGDQAKNILFTIEAINVAKELGCSKFIGAGSQAEFGRNMLDKLNVDSPTNPIQPYGIAKFAAGKLALEEAKRISIDCFWVRIFSVYGKYDKSTSMISSSIRKMLRGVKTSFTSAVQKWDYLYCDDAAEALFLIGERGVGIKIYCLGSGTALPLKNYIIVMRDAVDPKIKLEFGEIVQPDVYIQNLCADITELRNDISWEPRTPFSVGIQETIKSIRIEIR